MTLQIDSLANSQQPTANSQQPTANSQQPTANSQQPTANSQQPTASWIPPTNFEEKLKALLVPGAVQLWYHLAKEKRSGESEIHLVRFLADRKRISVDVGANRGIWAEEMRRFSLGVVAYEPNPKMFKVLKACAKPGVAVHQVALSDQSGLVNLMIPQGTKGFQIKVLL